MPITKATQSVITPSIVTTDTRQTITGEKVIECLYETTSTTSLNVGTGSKTLTVGTGLSWVAGRAVRIRNSVSTFNSMEGTVTSYNSVTGVMVANITTTGGGSATFSSWNVTQLSSTALPALRITSNDSANAFVVEDTTNPDTTPFVVSSSGHVTTNGITATEIIIPSTGRGINSSRYLFPIINSEFYGTNYGLQAKVMIKSGFTTQNDTLATDLLSYFDGINGLASTVSNPVRGFSVRALVTVFQRSINNTTFAEAISRAAYSANFTVQIYNSNSWIGGVGFTGYALNSTTNPAQGATTTLNITTAEGLFPTLSPAGSASGYASITAVRETTSANGTLTLTTRSFTGAPTAGFTYETNVGVILDITVL